jgi:hypothetical protein
MTKTWSLVSTCLILVFCSASFAEQPPNPAVTNSLPEGTTFLVRLEDRLDTNKLQQGKRFKVKLGEDLIAPNGATISRGKKIKGHVSAVENGLHAGMLLSFDEIETNHGWVPLVATITGVPGEHAAKTDEEGDIQRKGMNKKRMIETAAVGAGIGAIGGAAAGGGKGAGIGAGAGAGLGALAGVLTDRNLRLEKGTTLEVRLDRQLQVPTH